MSKWISVQDRLPLKWGMYLVRYIRNHNGGAKSIDHQVIHFNNERNKFNIEYTDDEVTHWMPLPEPPEGDE